MSKQYFMANSFHCRYFIPVHCETAERNCYQSVDIGQNTTVGINPIISEPQGPGTSRLDWRYLEHYKIDRYELQIRTNSQKGTETKMAE